VPGNYLRRDLAFIWHLLKISGVLQLTTLRYLVWADAVEKVVAYKLWN